jgi:alpha-beta hydrolase superfamily lysophospholipase
MVSMLKHVVLFATYGTFGAVLALVVAYAVHVSRGPALKPWHEATFTAEFRAADRERIRTLHEYVENEARVFEELRQSVYARIGPGDRRLLNRYFAGSPSDPTSYPMDWNRTIELAVESPRGAALLVHGLADSPYSMRALASRLHARGYHVVSLRLPGHGTAPSGLIHAHWEDWAAAVRLGTRHLRERVGPERPLHVIGFSTGAALAVEYSLARLGGEDLARVDGLVLLSPAIGVTPAAALAIWQSRAAAATGLRKLAWESIAPEYDPYRYNSFAINAGVQIHALTVVIGERIAQLASAGAVRGLPRIIAFQSAADATVSGEALVRTLFAHLAPEGHRLVVFDVNRQPETGFVLAAAAGDGVDRLLAMPPRPFALTVVTNGYGNEAEVAILDRPQQADAMTRTTTGVAWPRGVFSLSHVAVPFPTDDPHYGAERPAHAPGIYLGRPQLLGEVGFLALPEASLMRLRFNPFFAYMEAQIFEFMEAVENTRSRTQGRHSALAAAYGNHSIALAGAREREIDAVGPSANRLSYAD